MVKTSCLPALILAAALSGCGEKKCTMDTECPLPQVCLSGVCTDRGPKDGFTDTLPDQPPDGTDVPVDDDVEGDAEPDAWPPCSFVFADRRRLILNAGSSVVSTGPMDDPDFPVLSMLPSGSVWMTARIASSTTMLDTPKMTYITVDPRTANPSGTANYPMGSVALDAHHPTVPLGSSMATVMPDIHGYAGNQMIHFILEMPPSSGTPTGISGTDLYSRDPAVASAGTEMLAVWKQGNPTDSNSRLDYAVISAAGAETSRGTAAGDGTTQMGEPALAWSGAGYGLVYFVHGGVGADRVEFVELGADGTPADGSRQSWTPTESDTLLVGWPVIDWNDESYAILWEEALGSTTGSEAHLHFSMVGLGGASPTDTLLDDSLEPGTGEIRSDQKGMMDIAWNGRNWGVVWVNMAPLTGYRVWFFELAPSGSISLSPQLLNPDATQSKNPTLTWFETSTSFYWVFGWNEFNTSQGIHVLYSYSYGCSL